MKSPWVKIIENSGAQIYSLAMGMVILILTARWLGPEGRGVIAAVTSWVGLFAMFASLSLGQVVHSLIPRDRGLSWLPGTFGNLVFLAAVLSVLVCSVAVFMYGTSGGKFFGQLPRTVLLVGFLALPAQMWEQYASNLLMAAGRLRIYNLAQTIGRTIGVCVVLLTVGWSSWGIIGAVLGQTIGQILVAASMLVALWQLSGRRFRIDRFQIRGLLKGALQLHLNTIGAFILFQIDILMLNHFSTKTDVGWYQLSNQLIGTMTVIPQAASMVFFSRMAQKGPDEIWPEQKKIGLQVFALMLVLSWIAYVMAPWSITMVAGNAFGPSVKVFRYLLPVLLGLTLVNIMTNQWIGRGIFWPTTLATFITAMVNLSFNYIMIPKYGMMGAVWATLISFVGITVLVQMVFAIWCEKQYRKIVLGLAQNWENPVNSQLLKNENPESPVLPSTRRRKCLSYFQRGPFPPNHCGQ